MTSNVAGRLQPPRILSCHPMETIMSRISAGPSFDFKNRVSCDPDAKRLFHSRARRQLTQLATALGLAPGAYDPRSNQGGMAVSGEVTLHADRLYVQACQPATGHDSGVLFRTYEGRRDYIGGRNNFASLDLLHRPDELARRIREACHV
jgi:hypothetical protein